MKFFSALLSITVLCNAFASSAYSQNTISGVIKDAESTHLTSILGITD